MKALIYLKIVKMFKVRLLLFILSFSIINSMYLRDRKVFVFSLFDITSPQYLESIPVKRIQCFDSKYGNQEIICDIKEVICLYKSTTNTNKDTYKCDIDNFSVISKTDIVCESSKNPYDLQSITTHDSCYLKVYINTSFDRLYIYILVFFIVICLCISIYPIRNTVHSNR